MLGVRSAISPVSRRWFDFRLRRWAADEAVAPQGTQSTTHKKRIFFHAQIEVAHAGGRSHAQINSPRPGGYAQRDFDSQSTLVRFSTPPRAAEGLE